MCQSYICKQHSGGVWPCDQGVWELRVGWAYSRGLTWEVTLPLQTQTHLRYVLHWDLGFYVLGHYKSKSPHGVLHARTSCLKLCLWVEQACSGQSDSVPSDNRMLFFLRASKRECQPVHTLILAQWHKFWISVLQAYMRINLFCFKLWVLNGLLHSYRQTLKFW